MRYYHTTLIRHQRTIEKLQHKRVAADDREYNDTRKNSDFRAKHVTGHNVPMTPIRSASGNVKIFATAARARKIQFIRELTIVRASMCCAARTQTRVHLQEYCSVHATWSQQ